MRLDRELLQGRFEALVLTVIRLGEQMKTEWKEIADRSSFAENQQFFAGNGIQAMLSAPRPGQQALKAYVAALTDDDVMKLQTVMYLGQYSEEAGDLDALHQYLARTTPGRTAAERAMLTKTTLAELLRAGMKNVGKLLRK